MDPITILIELTDSIRSLDEVQSWIDDTRRAAPTNKAVQIVLDHRQKVLDRKRALVEYLMADTRNRN